MLKKENRLTKNKHFNYIYKHGQSVKNQHVVLVYAKTKVKPFKIGFSVSNKIGKATKRNKVKRRMREIVKSLIRQIDRRYNYIFVARESIVLLTYQELENQIKQLISKAELFNSEE